MLCVSVTSNWVSGIGSFLDNETSCVTEGSENTCLANPEPCHGVFALLVPLSTVGCQTHSVLISSRILAFIIN